MNKSQFNGAITPLEYQQLAARTEKMLPLAGRLQHGMLGIVTESGELGDLVKKVVIYAQPLVANDQEAPATGKFVTVDHMEEEIGDLCWYLALIANAAGIDIGKAMQRNIAKLRARYPEKYSDDLAAARLDKPAGE